MRDLQINKHGLRVTFTAKAAEPMETADMKGAMSLHILPEHYSKPYDVTHRDDGMNIVTEWSVFRSTK